MEAELAECVDAMPDGIWRAICSMAQLERTLARAWPPDICVPSTGLDIWVRSVLPSGSIETSSVHVSFHHGKTRVFATTEAGKRAGQQIIDMIDSGRVSVLVQVENIRAAVVPPEHNQEKSSG